MRKVVFSNKEIDVLNSLNKTSESTQKTKAIAEIASAVGIDSRDEIQRALFILEGRSLVEPEPAGDLTSNNWKITSAGVKALEFLASS
ncbi:MAG: hypothetical protein IT291_11105 [Deltaproteobacteria bacterium]|nr:hypothetical protein [Deltaproteobacteria bacterium]